MKTNRHAQELAQRPPALLHLKHQQLVPWNDALDIFIVCVVCSHPVRFVPLFAFEKMAPMCIGEREEVTEQGVEHTQYGGRPVVCGGPDCVVDASCRVLK